MYFASKNKDKQMTPDSVKSADRVLDVLEFICRRGSASHAEISIALGIPKSSLTHLLRNLVARRYLDLSDGTNMFELGEGFFGLLKTGLVGRDAAKLAEPYLSWLTSVTKEASSYGVFRGDCVERIAGVESDQPLSYRMSRHVRFPLYSSSGGKAILAILPPEEREAYLAELRIEPKTEKTVRTVDELRKQLVEIGDDRIALSRNEHTAGVIAIAIPVCRADNYPLGALNVVVPEVRFSKALEKLCRESLKTAAQRLERELHQ
jgi:DNA-binding IclR family transcriptional regulator